MNRVRTQVARLHFTFYGEQHIKSVHLTCSGKQKWHVSFQSARLSLDACPRCMEEITNGVHHLHAERAYSY